MTTHQMTKDGSYEVYQGKELYTLNSSLEEQLHTPPGGPTYHPPGSPKLRRDSLEQMKHELYKSQQEAIHFRKLYEDLQLSAKYNNLSEPNFDIVGNDNKEQDIKDSQIRHLKRQVTILQADIYKKDQLESRMMEVRKDLTKSKEELHRQLVQNKRLHEENEILKRENRTDKERLVLLEKGLREHQSPPNSTNSLQSLNSNTSYSKELECLHKMVDTLRATVLEQRSAFLKLGLQSRSINSISQSQPSNPSVAQVPKMFRIISNGQSSSNLADSCITTPSVPTSSEVTSVTLTSQPLRQAEESLERAAASSDMTTLSDIPLHIGAQSTRSNNYISNGHQVVSSGGNFNVNQVSSLEGDEMVPEVPRRSPTFFKKLGIQPEIGSSNIVNGMDRSGMTRLVGGGVMEGGHVSPRRSRQGSASSDFVATGFPVSNSAENTTANGRSTEVEEEVVYMNVQNPSLPSRNRNLPNHAVGQQLPKSPRKTSQSEIINRCSQVMEGNSAAGTKSKTENIGKSPNILTLQESETNLFQRSKSEPSRILFHRQDIPSFSPLVPSPDTWANGQPMPQPILRYQQLSQQIQLPASEAPSQHRNSSINSTVPANSSTILGNRHDMDTWQSSSPPLLPPSSYSAQTTKERPQNDRLCPVCNQNFSNLSMEDFQTHVFDCFDNENGPETLQPDISADYPPQMATVQSRTCPMCPQRFEPTISQSEYVQHVHRHFGEEPFEVLET